MGVTALSLGVYVRTGCGMPLCEEFEGYACAGENNKRMCAPSVQFIIVEEMARASELFGVLRVGRL